MDLSHWKPALRSLSPGRKARSVGGLRLGVPPPYEWLRRKPPAWCALCDIALRDFDGCHARAVMGYPLVRVIER